MTHWCALVPQKSLSSAKGRLELPAAQRRALAAAMLQDTVAALASTPSVVHTIVLWDDPADCSALDPSALRTDLGTAGLGLNGSIERGAAEARRRFSGAPLVVVPTDLPTLLPQELERCLSRARLHRRAFVADAGGIGTTILTATGDADLAPAYGEHSATAHEASGAWRLRGADLGSLRRDVDGLAALTTALAVGYGARTVACLAGIAATPEPVR
jgi:2-phospho-L-lactate/phosphoenolpyruvate guanylyltransferase